MNYIKTLNTTLRLLILFIFAIGANGLVFGQQAAPAKDIGTNKHVAPSKVANDPADLNLKEDDMRVLFLKALNARDEKLQNAESFKKDTLLEEKKIGIQFLRWEGLTSIRQEIFKPNASALAIMAKNELLQGELDAASSMLKLLAEKQGSASLEQLQKAAELAKQVGALWIARDSQQAIASFELAHSYQMNDFFVLDSLIRLYKITGKNDLALKHAQSLVFFAEHLLASDPTNNNWQLDLSSSLNILAEILQTQGQTDKAIAAFKRSLEIREKLAANESKNSGWQKHFTSNKWQFELSVSYDILGSILQMQGQLEQALVYYKKRLAITEKLIDREPNNSLWQRNLMISLEKISDILEKKNHLDPLQAQDLKNLKTREKPASHDTSDPLWQRNLRVSFGNLIDMSKSKGQLDRALSYSQMNLNTFEKLAASAPSNILLKRDVSANLDNVADILQTQGQLDQALAYYIKSLAIREALAASDPKNNEWQANLIDSYIKLSSLHPAPVNTALARKYLSSALTITQKLAAAGVLTDEQKTGWSAGLQKRLNDLR